MKVLVFENAPSAPVGLFGAWLAEGHGAELRIVTPQTMPDDPGDADLIVALGSPAGACPIRFVAPARPRQLLLPRHIRLRRDNTRTTNHDPLHLILPTSAHLPNVAWSREPA